MATNSMLKAFQLMSKLQNLPFRPKNIINWDPTTNRLKYGNKVDKVFSWYLIVSVYVFEMILLVGAGFAIKFGYTRFTYTLLARQYIDEACLFIYTHLVFLLALWLEWLFYRQGQDLVEYVNSLLVLQHSEQPRNHKDVLGSVAYFVVGSLPIVCIGLGILLGSGILPATIITIFYKSFAVQSTSPTFNIQNVVFGAAHLWGFVALNLEGGSAVCLGFLVALFNSSFLINHLNYIKFLSSKNCSTSVREYHLLQVVLQSGCKPISFLCVIFMGVGFYIFIFSVTLSALGWDLLSPLFFPLAPLTVGFCVVLLSFALPVTAKAINLSMELLRNWKLHQYHFKYTNRLYMQKFLRSLRPVNISCGPFGTLNGEKVTTYLYSIFDNSITGLTL